MVTEPSARAIGGGQPSPSSWSWLLLVVAALGLVLRLSFVLVHQGPTESVMLIGGDGVDYSLLAENVADGDGFISGITLGESARPPGWVMVLAGAMTVSGRHSMFAQQVTAALVGTLTVVLVGYAGRRIAGRRAGLIAAAIAAIYPGFWIYEWPLLSETLLLPAIALMLLAAYRFHDEPTLWRAVGLGALCGVLALIRSEQILVGFIVAALILLTRTVSVRRRATWLVAAGLATVLVVTPWILHNLDRFEEPVYLSTGLGNTLVAGNCDGTYEGALLGYYDTRCNFTFAAPAGIDVSELDALKREAALDYIAEHRGRVPTVALARIGRVAGAYRFTQTTELWSSWSQSPTWVVRTWLVMSWPMLAAAAYGAVVLRRRRVPIYPLLGFAAITVVVLAFTIGEVRYRASLEVPLVILAAAGIAQISRRFWPSRRRSEDPPEELRADQPADLVGIAEVPGAL